MVVCINFKGLYRVTNCLFFAIYIWNQSFVWKIVCISRGTVYRMMQQIYPTHACKEQIRNIQILERECGYSPHNIPQLEDVSNCLKSKFLISS